ncbi:MarR family winged helix-turn-helix transcriptional regulator [Tahibacter amnicola]|uniref:MarR family transcriptional regulator n=1 Tax=Tahibacter amnicola TaxID=2976241 RepID=A0ABY6BH33_9GAMM|nr:MarR family transcriptional regulator [Tahibacter amnicola]UXI67916.1 MarR family transcriptional regulator [Tahibacter amnicola]
MANVSSLVDDIARLYPAVYERLHARWDKNDPRPSPESLAVMQHLWASGPLTMGEAARHFDRALSAISELTDRLEARGWIARSVDSRDRRRILIWLTDAGIALLQRTREVLSREALSAALQRMDEHQRQQLLQGLSALVEASRSLPPPLESDHEP